MIHINGNKEKWIKFNIVLWDADIDISEVNKNPIDKSTVIKESVHFSIREKHHSKFKRLAKKHCFDFEYRK